jgi:hypothetical protein
MNLIPKADEALAGLMETLQLSRTDTVNRAIQVYAYLEQVMAAGGRVLVQPAGEDLQLMKII